MYCLRLSKGRFLQRLALLLLAAAVFAQTPTPDTLTRQGAPGPFFVSSAAATNANGSIRWESFDAASRLVLQRRTTGDPRCEDSTVDSVHVSGNTHSFEAMMTRAPAVYAAEITSMKQGFEGAMPTTLIAAMIRTVVRSGAGFPHSGTVYVLDPQADFRLAGRRFCNAGVHPAYTPQIGDQVMIFSYDPPNDMTGSFLLTRPEQLLFERGDRLFAARAFSHHPLMRNGSTLSTLERTIVTPR
ncbi:MAG TPA: hypothetical protein VGJ81_14320 [Thermoanaerobaculia bacterium]|jgi:hypothetical protein